MQHVLDDPQRRCSRTCIPRRHHLLKIICHTHTTIVAAETRQPHLSHIALQEHCFISVQLHFKWTGSRKYSPHGYKTENVMPLLIILTIRCHPNHRLHHLLYLLHPYLHLKNLVIFEMFIPIKGDIAVDRIRRRTKHPKMRRG